MAKFENDIKIDENLTEYQILLRKELESIFKKYSLDKNKDTKQLLINEEDRFLKSVYNNKNIKDNNNQIIVTDKLDINELTYFFYIHNLYKIKPLTDKIKDYFSSVNLWKYIALNDVKLPIKKEINRDLDDENLQLISKVFCSTDDLNKPNFLKPFHVENSIMSTDAYVILNLHTNKNNKNKNFQGTYNSVVRFINLDAIEIEVNANDICYYLYNIKDSKIEVYNEGKIKLEMIALKIKNIVAIFNSEFLLKCIETMIKLGYKDLILRLTKEEPRPMGRILTFFPKGYNKNNLIENDFTLVLGLTSGYEKSIHVFDIENLKVTHNIDESSSYDLYYNNNNNNNSNTKDTKVLDNNKVKDNDKDKDKNNASDVLSIKIENWQSELEFCDDESERKALILLIKINKKRLESIKVLNKNEVQYKKDNYIDDDNNNNNLKVVRDNYYYTYRKDDIFHETEVIDKFKYKGIDFFICKQKDTYLLCLDKIGLSIGGYALNKGLDFIKKDARNIVDDPKERMQYIPNIKYALKNYPLSPRYDLNSKETQESINEIVEKAISEKKYQLVYENAIRVESKYVRKALGNILNMNITSETKNDEILSVMKKKYNFNLVKKNSN